MAPTSRSAVLRPGRARREQDTEVAQLRAAVGRAEARLAADYRRWLAEDVTRLRAGLAALRADPAAEAVRRRLRAVAWSVEEEAAGFALPPAARIGAALGRLLATAAPAPRRRIDLAAAHVDALALLAAGPLGDDGDHLAAALEAAVERLAAAARPGAAAVTPPSRRGRR